MKVYLKFLARNRAYTIINMAGLVAALVFVLLLGLYVSKENSADTFHEKGDRIYRLLMDGQRSYAAFPLAADIRERYPEVESTVRVAESNYLTSRSAGSEKSYATALVTDSTFFTVFSFPLKEGDPKRQIESSTDVTISENFATRMFGTEDPMGRSIIIDNKPHTVTGVVGTFPKSHLKTPDVIVRLDNTHLDNSYFDSGYSNNSFPLYILARQGANLPAKADDMVEWFKTFYWTFRSGLNDHVVFEPITESYFNTYDVARDMYASNSRSFIVLLMSAVLAILLFALINYVNLSAALGGFRAKEAAMRRLLGASRARLLVQYMLESVLFCAIAFALALLIALAIEPTFNNIMESDVSLFGALQNPIYVVGVLGVIAVLGMISGLSPALVITRVKPIDVVKGEFSRRTRMVWSRIFIVFQLCLTMVLIGCAITIGRQSHYMRTTDLGFNAKDLYYFHNPNLSPEQLDGVRSRLLELPGVEMVSSSQGTPLSGNNSTDPRADGRVFSYTMIVGDTMLMETLGFEVVRRTGVSDADGVWLNEEAVRQLELAPDSLSFAFYNDVMPLLGVVRNFHARSLVDVIPAEMIIETEDFGWAWQILVRATPGVSGVDKAVERVLVEASGQPVPMIGSFEEAVEQWSATQHRLGRLIAGFSVMAVLISVMGLVAMTTYFMRQRRRDIAVRRVFGATEEQMLERLVGSFMVQVLFAFVFAVPLIWWLMSRWLSTFAYRIGLSWWIFVLAGVVVAVVALAAVWWQSLAAARRNPVLSLKSE